MSAPPIRTLVVDDDPAVRRLHAAYLSALDGFALVGSARTGAEGIRLLAGAPVDLVLLDMQLPDFSGIEVLHRLRALRDLGTDVIVISSARDGITVRQAMGAQIADYLVKPFTERAFAERLTAYRDARRARTPEVPVSLGQGEIDGMLRARAATTPPRADPAAAADAPLPAGVSAPTLALVLAALDPQHARSARDVAAAAGVSRATARRYLDHLVGTGVVDVSHRFGARGRPEVLYRAVAG